MQAALTREHQRLSPQKSSAPQELEDAGNLCRALLHAWKNSSLYPEGHTSAQKSLAAITAAFADFFAKHGSLDLVVAKDRLLWLDSVIHEVPPEATADEAVYLLYRDGITSIAFLPGLPREELASFFRILNKYRLLKEESEGDIVTALTDANLAHIKFKAINIFWQDHPPLDFSSLKLPASETTGEDSSQMAYGHAEQWEEAHKIVSAKSIADPSFSEALWEIYPEEQKKLQKMVLQEENWDNVEDVFDVLMVILRSQTDQYNFSAALDFTLEEVQDTIEQGEFRLLLNLFQTLHQLIFKETTAEPSWMRLLIERFFQDLSRPEIIDHIRTQLLALDDNDVEKIKALRQVLLYFSPDIMLTLGPLIQQTRSLKVRKILLEVIEYLCLKDMSPMEKILDHADKALEEKLLPVLGRLKGERATRIYLKMLDSPSEKLRIQGIRMLTPGDGQLIQRVFSLIDDSDFSVRKEVFAGIAQQKSSVVENLLLKYMKERLGNNDSLHTLACYEALGRCGSVTATQFLKRILLSQGWNRFTGFGKSLHREGAAMALALMGTWEAKDILREASTSRYRVIRQALQNAMARNKTLRDTSHG